MKELEKEVENLFTLCEEMNKVSQSVDMNSTKKYLSKIVSKSQMVFLYLENSASYQNVANQFSHKETIVKLCYVILKSIYMLQGNYRSYMLNNMAYMLMNDANYLVKFGNEGNWVKNNDVFAKGLNRVIYATRPELLEKVIADLLNLLRNPGINHQITPDYMNRFIYHMGLAYSKYFVQV